MGPSHNHGLLIILTFEVLLLLATCHVEPLFTGCAPYLRVPMWGIQPIKIAALLTAFIDILKIYKSELPFERHKDKTGRTWMLFFGLWKAFQPQNGTS